MISLLNLKRSRKDDLSVCLQCTINQSAQLANLKINTVIWYEYFKENYKNNRKEYLDTESEIFLDFEMGVTVII